MNKKLSVVIYALSLFACGEQVDQPGRFADLVLRNGNVLTVDGDLPKAQAIAIVGDKIIAVGSNQDIDELTGDATIVVDVTGQTVIPGFIEGHGHYLSFGSSLCLRHGNKSG